jgi:hypothetical protein
MTFRSGSCYPSLIGGYPSFLIFNALITPSFNHLFEVWGSEGRGQDIIEASFVKNLLSIFSYNIAKPTM